jgi:hypothetical protein
MRTTDFLPRARHRLAWGFCLRNIIETECIVSFWPTHSARRGSPAQSGCGIAGYLPHSRGCRRKGHSAFRITLAC